jgi:hypothetical protein
MHPLRNSGRRAIASYTCPKCQAVLRCLFWTKLRNEWTLIKSDIIVIKLYFCLLLGWRLRSKLWLIPLPALIKSNQFWLCLCYSTGTSSNRAIGDLLLNLRRTTSPFLCGDFIGLLCRSLFAMLGLLFRSVLFDAVGLALVIVLLLVCMSESSDWLTFKAAKVAIIRLQRHFSASLHSGESLESLESSVKLAVGNF